VNYYFSSYVLLFKNIMAVRCIDTEAKNKKLTTHMTGGRDQQHKKILK